MPTLSPYMEVPRRAVVAGDILRDPRFPRQIGQRVTRVSHTNGSTAISTKSHGFLVLTANSSLRVWRNS